MCFKCYQLSASVITNLLTADSALPLLHCGLEKEPNDHHVLRLGLALLCSALRPIGEDATSIVHEPDPKGIEEFRARFTPAQTAQMIEVATRMSSHLDAVAKFTARALLTGLHDKAMRAVGNAPPLPGEDN